MPPEPQAGSKTLPWNGSMISTISRTIDCGVKNSPPSLPSVGGELGEEVLVDQAERVARERARQRREEADELERASLFSSFW